MIFSAIYSSSHAEGHYKKNLYKIKRPEVPEVLFVEFIEAGRGSDSASYLILNAM